MAEPFGRFCYAVLQDRWSWSPEVFHALGLDPRTAVPGAAGLLAGLDEPDRARVALLLVEAMRDARPFSAFVRAGDGARWLVLVGEPAPAEAGRVEEIRGHVVDVSARMRTELQEQEQEQGHAAVEAAMLSRSRIEQAKGALMLAYDLDEDQAFGQLVWQSKQANIKLRELAQRLLRGIAEARPASAETRRRLDELLYGLPDPVPANGLRLRRVDLTVRTWRSGEAVVLTVAGEVDLATAPELDAALAAALNGGGGPERVVLDATAVTHLGSVGVGLLARYERRCARNGHRLLLAAGTDGPVASVLALAAPYLKVYADVDTALAAARSG